MSPWVQLLCHYHDNYHAITWVHCYVQKTSLLHISLTIASKLFSYPISGCILSKLLSGWYGCSIRGTFLSLIFGTLTSYSRNQDLNYPYNCVNEKIRNAYANIFISLTHNVLHKLRCFWDYGRCYYYSKMKHKRNKWSLCLWNSVSVSQYFI